MVQVSRCDGRVSRADGDLVQIGALTAVQPVQLGPDARRLRRWLGTAPRQREWPAIILSFGGVRRSRLISVCEALALSYDCCCVASDLASLEIET